MLKIIFSDPTTQNPFGKIKAEFGKDLLGIKFSQEFPLTFQVTNAVDKKIRWSSKLYPGTWSSFVEPCNTHVEIIDPDGNFISSWRWDTFLHGDDSHVLFMLWCLKNKGAKGIAIGTHDGTTGEWVEPLRSGLIEAFLTEASISQYNDLVENYKDINKCFPIFSLITPDGGDCEFFESPGGFTNSVLENHVLNYSSDVTKVVKKSKLLNDLICEVGLSTEIKWLHLDVEGIDADLIMSLDESRVKLPEFIIYESINLSSEKKEEVCKWLSERGYSYKESGWNTIAHKISNISLLIQTCDHYEQFWPGMFYTLDFYWDYDSFPVYFANEEKKIEEMTFNCKGNNYTPSRKITQILTGKTDRNGFSDRFIKSIEKVPSKWVLYIQEDMWLRRGIEKDLLEDLIKFAEEKNADSIKIHSTLFYYDSYRLDKTDDFIKGKRILKYSEGENFLLSHNATIWRKDYILRHQRVGEDAWSNEVEGSKRMSSEPHNHYHYEMHWHCQPGISDKGEFSPEGHVYGHIVDEMKRTEMKFNLMEEK